MSKTKNKTAAAALKILKEGNKQFVADKLKHELQDSGRRGKLTDGQAPFAIVLSCADSRVVPELAFDVGLGEIFVIRVAGNIANTSTIASIEYAVAHLGVKLIVGDNGHNLNHLLAHITPALGSKSVNSVVKKNAKLQANDLASRSDIIGGAKGLQILPAYYELGSGKVKWL